MAFEDPFQIMEQISIQEIILELQNALEIQRFLLFSVTLGIIVIMLVCIYGVTKQIEELKEEIKELKNGR